MVSKAFCDRWRRQLFRNASPDFSHGPPYPDFAYGDHCGVDIENLKVSRAVAKRRGDPDAHHGSIYRYQEKSPYVGQGRVAWMEGDVPVLSLITENKHKGLHTGTAELLVADIEGCGCEHDVHEHLPALHVHFKCVGDRAVSCAMDNALRES